MWKIGNIIIHFKNSKEYLFLGDKILNQMFFPALHVLVIHIYTKRVPIMTALASYDNIGKNQSNIN